MKSAIVELYTRWSGVPPGRVADLRPDGSNRRLWRLFASDGSTVIGVFGPDREENDAFISYSLSFRSIALPVPEILAVDRENQIYLEEDLGDLTLFDLLARDRQQAHTLYRRVVTILPRFQVEGGGVFDDRAAFPRKEFDRTSMMWDLNYFKYHFLKLAHVPFHEGRLEQDFERLCDALLEHDRGHFLYRDFQSRNIMVREGSPWFIDYQGGRRGALQYDVASLLYDARANLSPAFRSELLRLYCATIGSYTNFDEGAFLSGFPLFALIRILQAMGAYGYRGFYERKEHFLTSVPYAVENIKGLLDDGLPVDLPELVSVLRSIPPGGKKGEAPSPSGDGMILQVAIRSFSYRRGYPQETSEHGGGFVFDCRQVNNPGRIAAYRNLSGRDREVIAYLESDPRVERFFQGVLVLVDGAVENFLERGFTSMVVSFGCTGGQHRSVYFAERLARSLTETRRRIRVDVEHRERNDFEQS